MFDIYNEEAYHPTAVDQQCGDHLYTHRFSTPLNIYLDDLLFVIAV
jgi:hypothetical protein